jgi:hypothetical protein
MTHIQHTDIIIRLIFPAFFLILFQSCNSMEEEYIDYYSEKILIERLQLDCNNQFKKSEMTYNSIKEIKHDPANESLALIAAKQLNIADTLDISIREIISIIEEIKLQLIAEKVNGASFDIKNKVIVPYEPYFPLRPSIIDLNHYDFVSTESRSTSFKFLINDLKNRIESLRKDINQKTLKYYGKANSTNQAIITDKNFKTLFDEFNSKDLAYRKSNEYLCGEGEIRRIYQIDLELVLNRKYWEMSYSEETPTPLIFCHLISLQSNILNTRNLIFELMSLNLHCENMKMRK